MRKTTFTIIIALCLFSFAAGAELADDIASLTRAEIMSAVTDNTDPWDKYLLEQAVSVESLAESSAAVSVLSWDVDGIENTDGASLPHLVQSLNSSVISGNISYSYDVSGKLQIFGVDALRKNILSAASKAKDSFNSQWMRLALSAGIFPTVYGQQGGYTDAFEELKSQYADTVPPYALEAALTLQKPTQLNGDDGPKALKMELARVNAGAVARSAYIASYDILKNTDKSNAYSREQIGEILTNCFIQSAFSVSDEDYAAAAEAVIDMERILSGDLTNQAVVDYAKQIDALLNEKLDTLMIAVSYLPDYPARNQPETGVLKGPVSGTHVVFVSPDDGYGRIVSLLVPATGQTALELFMQSGDSVDAYVPSGKYVLQYGKGSEWYGEIKRFGSDAAYARSIVNLEISQSDKYHVISFVGDSIDGVTGIKLPMNGVEYVEPD